MGFNLFKPSSWDSSGSNTPAGAPAQNPNAFQYGGVAGGAQAAQANYASQQQQAQAQQAAQVSNPYAAGDLAQAQGVQQGMQGLQGYYQGQMNMGVNSPNNLGTAEANAATAQGIAAQQAQANSVGGSLGAAGAQRGAAQNGVAMQNQTNQNAAINTIQQQQAAAAGASSLYGQQAQTALGEQGINNQSAQYQAGLNQQQNALGDQTGLAYAGLGAGVAQSQLGAQEAGQQYNLGAAGQNTQNAQFNAGQTQNAWGTVLGGLGAMASMGDADLKEPGPLAGAHHGLGPAGETLREESGSPGEHDPFILDVSHQTGQMRALATRPLTPSEKRQVMAPHGAGPLDSPNRIHTDVHDMGLAAGPDATTGMGGWTGDAMAGPAPGDLAMAQAGQRAGARPMMQSDPAGAGAQLAHQYGGIPNGAGAPAFQPGSVTNPQAPREAVAQALMQRNPMMQSLAPASLTGADLDLAAAPTHKGQQAHAPFQLDHDADEVYRPVPGDIAGGTERDRKAQEPTARGTVPATAHFSDAPGDLGDSLSTAAIQRATDPYAGKTGKNTHDEYHPEVHEAGASDTKTPTGAGGMEPGFGERMQDLGAAALAPLDPTRPGTPWGDAGAQSTTPTSGVARQDIGRVSPSVLAKPPGQPGAAPGQGAPVIPPMAGAGGAAHAAYAPTGRPQDIDALKAAQGAEVSAQRAVSAADQQAQIVENASHADKARQLGEDQAQIQRQAEEHDLYLQQQTNKRDWLAKDAKEAGENYGLHPSAAQSIRYTIASFLGAIGTGLNHGMPNVAAQNIARHQDQELDRQRQVIEAKKGRVADQDTLLAQAYRRFGNMDQAMAAARQVATQKSIEELAAFAGASKNQQLIAAGDQAAAVLKSRIAQDDLKLYKPVTVGGGAAGMTRAKFDAEVAAIRDKFPDLTSEQAQRQVLANHGMGPPQGALPVHEKGGADKPNPDAAALLALANDKGLHGQDWYDRNAPDFLRSSESLRNEVGMRALGNETAKAEGARAAPVTVSTGDVIGATIGRGTDEDVETAKKRARKLAEAKMHAREAEEARE